MEEFSIPGIVLMENAGAGAARTVAEVVHEDSLPYPEPFHILCGPGNNGGDGLVAARHLHNMGFDVRIQLVGIAAYPPGSDADVQLKIVRRWGLPLREAATGPETCELFHPSAGGGTVVDALFGTGLSRPLRSPYLEWVEAVNAREGRVFAIDIPSGLDANSGEVLGAAVRADHTITFAAPKVGFERGAGPRLTGKVHVIDIGIPRELWGGYWERQGPAGE
jgi:NAD(P)H-hydrate epimerase